MNGLIVPLIMCGGAGTRLWPASREGRPKQFLPLFGKRSTFQQTLLRVADAAIFARPVVVTNERYRFLVGEQIAEIGCEADIILEPMRRDSAAAVAAGAAFASRSGGDPVMVALAADHIIDGREEFVAACVAAARLAGHGRIVTFGIAPTRASTDYGYIQPGSKLSELAHEVARFVEKPDAVLAEQYVRDGFLWNSGNFVFQASTLLEELSAFEPSIADAVKAAVDRAKIDLGFVKLEPQAFAAARAVSLDYAVMEKTRRAAVLPVSFGWSDVGSWRSAWELGRRDASGNVTDGNAVLLDTSGSYVHSGKPVVALLGVKDLVVVVSDDAVLVADRARVTDVKVLVDRLRAVAPEVIEEHLTVYRPWGSYQSLDRGDRYHVKRIVVKPGARLSLQMHHHRAEHWVVVRGIARVTIGAEAKTLQENESTFIPLGMEHRLENPGKIDLELIEVQSGSYLGEDDIVRIEDDYNRLGGELIRTGSPLAAKSDADDDV